MVFHGVDQRSKVVVGNIDFHSDVGLTRVYQIYVSLLASKGTWDFIGLERVSP